MAEPLPLPERFHEPLRTLAGLSEDDAAGVSEFLSRPRENIVPSTMLAEQLAAAVPALGDAADAVISAAVGLLARDDHREAEAVKAVPRVAIAESLGLPDDQREVFIARFTELMRAPAVQIAAKAVDLTTDYERVYMAGKILTDMRPVFAGEETDTPAGALIVHTLKVDYYGPDRSVNSIHFALDSKDLRDLSEAVKRGADKADALRRFLEAAPLRHIEDAAEGGTDGNN